MRSSAWDLDHHWSSPQRGGLGGGIRLRAAVEPSPEDAVALPAVITRRDKPDLVTPFRQRAGDRRRLADELELYGVAAALLCREVTRHPVVPGAYGVGAGSRR